MTCSQSLNSPLCMIQLFFGRMALVAHLRLSYKVCAASCWCSQKWKKCNSISGAHSQTLFSVLVGAMYPTSMRINEEGRLVVNFKTEARFRGQFVMSHPGEWHPRPQNLSSVVILYSNLLLHYPAASILSSSISGVPH